MRGLATLAFLTLAGGLGAAAPAEAQDCYSPGRRLNVHERVQVQRIREGWREGDLTRLETGRLLAEQAAIRAEERAYRRTGHGIGPLEAIDLRRDLGRSSGDIYRQRHDGQIRGA